MLSANALQKIGKNVIKCLKNCAAVVESWRYNKCCGRVCHSSTSVTEALRYSRAAEAGDCTSTTPLPTFVILTKSSSNKAHGSLWAQG